MVIALMATLTTTGIKANALANSNNVCMTYAQNDGAYTKTCYSVSIYTENGHPKGVFAVYLHSGKRHINFFNTWICIQGKSRFAYCGNWYVIK